MENSVKAGIEKIQSLARGPKHWGWVQGMYLAGNDCGIALRFFHGQDYEPYSRSLWRKLCKDAQIVLDVGAHTGVYSLDAFKAGAKEVLSIEPYFMNYARLVMNLRYNGFPADSAILCAASSRDAFMTLKAPAPNYYCSAGCTLEKEERPQVGEFTVRTRPLDDLIKEQYHSKIKVAKIDTENHGGEVLKGMGHILSYKPALLLECTEIGLTEILKPLGYRFYHIHEINGLTEVERLEPDSPFSFDSPNRLAIVGEIDGLR